MGQRNEIGRKSRQTVLATKCRDWGNRTSCTLNTSVAAYEGRYGLISGPACIRAEGGMRAAEQIRRRS